jgi:hypothetical protein
MDYIVSYDVITVVGAYQHGQMPYDGILEMIRLAKTGYFYN